MGTMADKLQAILDSKAAIKTAISNKGGTITDSTPLDEYATEIDNIINGVEVLNGTITNIISNNITKLKPYIFKDNTNLVTVNIPNCTLLEATNNNQDGIQFYGCTNLKTVILGELSAKIASQTFYDCSSLETITFTTSDANFRIGSQCFRGCASLEHIILPINGTGVLDSYALQNCTSLKTVNLKNCTSINVWAFSNDTALESITIEKDDTICTLAGVNAFNNITGPVTIYVPSTLISSYQTATNWSTLYNNGVVTFSAIV